ncbi:MAG: DUF485 domain-containing protein [Chloroflexi bacterium]|nr:DUF485 domain-containing protein [Chloroflexota bacterium]
MHHGPAVKLESDNAADPKAKLGLVLFFVYSLVYVGFIIINTLSPKTMGESIVLGLNLAVVYGFGLILLAIVMGLIYNIMCNRIEKKLNIAQETVD